MNKMKREGISYPGRIVPLLVGLLGLACSSSGPSDGGIAGPPIPAIPAITVIEPAEAVPGDRITIRGQNFGTEKSAVAVTVSGVSAQVVSVASATIVAVLPRVATGTAAVVVTVGGRASTPFSYRVSTVQLPAISGIEPARARPGDLITITGTNFAGPTDLTVTVGEQRATVMSANPTAVVAVVPLLASGTADVVVSVRGRASSAFAFEILQVRPVISSILPNPTRADLALTILGHHLAGSPLQVRIDDSPVDILSATDTRIVIRTPSGIAVGNHSLYVQSAGERSQPFSFAVDDFSVTGTYDLRAVVVRVGPTAPYLCPVAPPVGAERSLAVQLTDNRPALDAILDETIYNGTVDSNGRFTIATGGSKIAGTVTRSVEDGRLRFAIDMTIERLGFLGSQTCSRLERATGFRR